MGTKKGLLLSLMVIGAVAAMITAATSASFSDTVTSNGNSFKTGTLNMSLDGQCGGTNGVDSPLGGPCDIGVVSFTGTGTALNLKPGDSVKHTFTLHNAGSLNISGFTIAAAWDPADNGLSTCDGSNSATIAAPATAAGIAANGTDTTFDVTVALPQPAGNTCQNKTGKVNITVVAAQ